jgi:uncharacterized protein
MQWRNLAFLHWPVPVASFRPAIPADLEIDTFDGMAWLGLVPFSMAGVRHAWLPAIPTANRFHECNVRTYVTDADGVSGVWFFSLDAVSRLAVFGGRYLWNLNYVHARIDVQRRGAITDYDLRRVRDPHVTMRCRWEALEPLPPSRPGSLEHFLTERYVLFAQNRRGQILRGRIWHDHWPLKAARLDELSGNLPSVAASIAPALLTGGPLCHHAERLDVRAWPLEKPSILPRGKDFPRGRMLG